MSVKTMTKQQLIDYHGRTNFDHKMQSKPNRILITNLRRHLNIGDREQLQSLDEKAFQPRKLMAIANRIQGNRESELASKLIIQTLYDDAKKSASKLLSLLDKSEKDFRDELVVSIERCHRRLKREPWNKTEVSPMSAVLTMAYLVWPRMYTAHVGDSRCYLFRDQHLRQITTDHTVAQQLVDGGALKKKQAVNSPWRNVIWNCLGGENDNIAPEIKRVDLLEGDIVLMCSGELGRCLTDTEIESILCTSHSSQELSRALIEAADERNCVEDTTVIVACFPKPVSSIPSTRHLHK